MIGRSLRARSSLAAGASILLALVLVGSAIDVLVSRHLRSELDSALRLRAADVAQLSASAPALLTTPGALDAPVGGTQSSVEVLDRRGRIVARSLSLGGRVLPASAGPRAAIARGVSGYADVTLAGERFRLYSAPLADVGGPAAGGAVVVAASTVDLRSTLGSLHLFVLLSALGAAVVAALAVALLTRRALRPLERLTDAAADIERTGDARRRLPEAGEVEVARLAITLNGMLASLERARESERRFLADASHELRTPLTALRGNVAYLARHGSTPQLVEELEHDAGRLAALADDLLTLSREEAAEPPAQAVRLDELALAEAALDVDVRIDARPSVRGDAAALGRAVANLVANARRHGPAGGRVQIAVEQRDGRALLHVFDEGPGLAHADAERAFARFWRARTDALGSGLGLAIVRATAERHGGSATAEGSRFTIELPVLRDVSGFEGTVGASPEKGSP